MKRLVGALLAIGALVVAGAPLLVGILLEREIHDSIQASRISPQLIVSVDRYERGWFESRATLSYSIEPLVRAILESAAGESGEAGDVQEMREQLASWPLSLSVVLDLEHGPFTSLGDPAPVFFRSTARIDPRTPGLAAIEAALGVEDLIVARATTRLDRVSRFVVETPEVDSTLALGRLRVAASRTTGEYRRDSGQIEVEGALPSLAARGDGFDFQLEAFSFDVQGQIVDPGLFEGTNRSRLADVGISLVEQATGRQREIYASDIEVSSETSLSEPNGTVRSEQHWSIDELSGFGERPLREVRLSFFMEKIDRAIFELWSRGGLGLASSGGGGRAALERLESLALPALRKSPSTRLGPLHVLIGDESLEGSMTLAVDGESLSDDFELGDVATLLASIEATGTLQMPRSIALELARQQLRGRADEAVAQGETTREQATAWIEQQAPQVLDELVLEGWLELNARGYRLALELDRGRLHLNGKPLPIDLLERAARAQQPTTTL